MLVKQTIEQKLAEALQLAHLDVVNESSSHNVPANSETHFKVNLVSSNFEGKKLIERHRMVNQLLADELAGPVHALAIHTYTQAEWQKRHGEAPMSPPCMGGETS
ncbi:MAG: BolA protein [Candidatus Azotimanducaceae bacterium]|jgi:BolA protein